MAYVRYLLGTQRERTVGKKHYDKYHCRNGEDRV